MDHGSRRIMGFAVFRQPPSSHAIRAALERLIWWVGCPLRHLISDHGRQFVTREFRCWCLRQGIRQRFGAVGLHGSLAVIERCIRTLKSEDFKEAHRIDPGFSQTRRNLNGMQSPQ